MPKKPKDQSREEKNGSENQRTFSSVTLATQEAGSISRMLSFPCEMSTLGFNSEPAMVQWNALHFTTATLETFDQRDLGFQMDDIS